jgi:hypothetical protein
MASLSSFGSMIPRICARLRVVGLISSCLLVLLLVGAATAAPSKASAAKISAHLTKTSFKSSQARSVKLIYKFSAPSKSFAYKLTFKKGSKWQTVKSVKKKGSFKGKKSLTVKKVFAGKSIKVGSYRLKLSADGGSKLLKFKVVKASSSGGSTSGGSTKPPVSPTPLRFSMSGAVGLALGSSSLSGTGISATRNLDLGSMAFWGAKDSGARYSAAAVGSNLDTVSSSGQLSDAVTSGSATVSQFLIAPNNKVYVLFSGRVNLSDTSSSTNSGCLLAEINPSSGVPVCVDNSLASINWSAPGSGWAPSTPIQFDSSGAIYYIGSTTSGATVLRKFLNGVSTDLITDNVYIDHFLVLPNGCVILSGRTVSSGAIWVRRISPGGSLSNLQTNQALFLTLFPDGNVYMGLWSNGGATIRGVARYLAASDSMDATLWIGSHTYSGHEVNFDTDTICPLPYTRPFCATYGVYIRWSYGTGDGREYVTAGADSGVNAMQYYPDVRFLNTIVTNVTVAQGVGNNLVLGGLNADNKNVLTLYNTSDDTETQLIGPDNEIEIYHVNYVADANKIMFDGLRFVDNKYVIEEIDLSTKQITELNTSSVKWADLQTFG